MIKWILQNNLGDRSGSIDKLISFLELFKIEFETIKVIPFSTDLPEVKNDKLCIFYGSTTLIKNVANSKKWNPGVWFNPESYEFEKIKIGYGDCNLLNGDSRVETIGNFLNEENPSSKLFFVRPAADFKEFAGGLFTFAEAKFQWNKLEYSNGDLNFNTKIQVAEPKNILSEYRTIIVDRKVVTTSQYKKDERFYLDSSVPARIVSFANEMAKLYTPAEIFTMDICELPNHKLKIIELNTFNCSGFYYCDFYEIVKQVTNYTSANYSI